MGANVTMPLVEYQEQVDARARAETRVVQLEAKLLEIEIGNLDRHVDGADVTVAGLLKGYAAAWQLVQFLIAHGHPDVIKSQPWPWEALEQFATTLEQLPGSLNEKAMRTEAATDMRLLVEEAKQWNTLRAERKYQASVGQELGAETTPSQPDNS